MNKFIHYKLGSTISNTMVRDDKDLTCTNLIKKFSLLKKFKNFINKVSYNFCVDEKSMARVLTFYTISEITNMYIYIVSLCFDFSVVQCSIHKK